MKKIIKFLILLIFALGLLLLPNRNVAADARLQYRPEKEGIQTGYYQIDQANNYLLGVAPGTSAAQISAVCLPKGTQLSADVAATGAVLSAPGCRDLTVVVTGDVNGDGAVSADDLEAAQTQTLTGAALAAADVNFDGLYSDQDAQLLAQVLAGKRQIFPTNPNGKDTMLLLTPGKSATWTIGSSGKVGYRTDDPRIAVCTTDGSFTAVAPGVTFAYACDPAGNILQRIAVTVVNTPLALSSCTENLTMHPNQKEPVDAGLNHPFGEPLIWESTDPAIAQVDKSGNVTAVSAGSCQIKVLCSAAEAIEVPITVLPNLEEAKFEKKLIKVKPDHDRDLNLQFLPEGCQEPIIYTSSDPQIATVDENGTVTGIGYGTVTIEAKGKYSGITATCSVKVCDVKQVSITFDDGPSIFTPKLLDYLKEKEVPVTFFLIGCQISQHGDTIKRQIAEGHAIAYHSYDHSDQRNNSPSLVAAHYNQSAKLLMEHAGGTFSYWRAPGGYFNRDVLNAVPLPHIYWSLDTRDWVRKNAQSVYEYIIKNVKDGDIILLHDLYLTSVDAAIMAIDEMVAGDYEFVSLEELLSRDGTPPENHKNYFKG